MVVLLIGMAVTAIWMGAALPAWRQQAVREKEAELIFRGEQYARAIFLYRQENAQAPPPNIDTLVNRRYLRKKYLDPMTGKEFVPVAGASVNNPGPGRGGQVQQDGPQGQVGITGVRSTSTESSIVLYQNQQVYNQFPFDWMFEAQRSGAMGPANVPPDGRGGSPIRGGGPGRPGRGGPARGGIESGIERPAGRGGRGGGGERGRQGGAQQQLPAPGFGQR